MTECAERFASTSHAEMAACLDVLNEAHAAEGWSSWQRVAPGRASSRLLRGEGFAVSYLLPLADDERGPWRWVYRGTAHAARSCEEARACAIEAHAGGMAEW